MTPQEKVIKAAKQILYWNEMFQEPADQIEWDIAINELKQSVTAYDQEQSTISKTETVNKQSAKDFLNSYGCGSGTNYYTGFVAGLLTEFASQQTAPLLKMIEEKDREIDNLRSLLFGKYQESGKKIEAKINSKD